MAKERVLYKQTYKSGVFLLKGTTPVCRHQPEGLDVTKTRLLTAGVVEIDGEELTFHDLRVYFKERK